MTQRPNDAKVPTVFMHIPKASGSSLRLALLEALAPSSPLFGHDRSLFGRFEAFETMEPEIRQSIFFSENPVPINRDFVAGNVSFSTLTTSYAHANFITVLR